MMCETPYIYTPEIAQKDFERKANNCNRVWFAILLDDIVIGNVYLKKVVAPFPLCLFKIAIKKKAMAQRWKELS